MKWTDGSVYSGEWFRGIQHGSGKMLFPNNTVKEGYFENNIYKGKVNPLLATESTRINSSDSN